MKARDHVALLVRIYKESGVAAIALPIALVFTVFGAFYDLVLSEDQKRFVTEVIRNMLGYWPYALFLTMLLVIAILYRRLLPTVDIVFVPNDGRYCIVKDGVRRYRVDLLNRGEWAGDISFRVESIRLEDGSYYPLDQRRGFQREAARGPAVLSPDSPKWGFVAEMDEARSDSKIILLLHGLLEDNYPDLPTPLERGTYYLEVSLNPRAGRRRVRTFRLSVVGNKFIMAEERKNAWAG